MYFLFQYLAGWIFNNRKLSLQNESIANVSQLAEVSREQSFTTEILTFLQGIRNKLFSGSIQAPNLSNS